MGEVLLQDGSGVESALLGGISSQFRINPFTGGHLTVRRAEGAVIETADGQTYLDMFMAHGSTVVGHGHPSVMQAVRDSLSDGVVVGYETGLGEVVANRIVEMVPSAEAVRFTASGSEAVGSAMRLARAHTGRDVIIKIDGHFHGGTDYAMVNSLAANTDRDNPGGRPSRAILSSGGIPVSVTESVVPVPWNDLPALEAAFAAHPDQVAGVIMVPIDFNNGCITTTAEYLAAALEMSHRHGALLIFDEILSGFKTGPGGAQALYGVLPDLTLLSKCVSSGVPLSVLCGRREVMDTLMLPPPRGAIQGGTFAGNIMGLAAAGATLDLLSAPSFYPELLARSERFFRQLQGIFDASPIPARVQWLGCMFTVYMGTRDPVTSYAQMRALDTALAKRYFSRCIADGVYFHTDFTVSAAHSESILDQVLERMERATSSLA
ncbi:MAG: aspartate aminotransferase family protein [Candidatus Dormibacteria bacterium]